METRVVIQCLPVTEVINVPCVVRCCIYCKAGIWLEVGLAEEVGRLHPGAQVHTVCPSCLPPGDGHFEVTPGQVALMRARGVDGDEMLYMFAIFAMAAGPGDDPAAVMEAVEAAPADSPLRERFEHELHKAAALVALIDTGRAN